MAYKYACLVSSGWLGNSQLKEFRSDDNGRGPDYLLCLINRLASLGVKIYFDKVSALKSNLPVFELHIESQRPKLSNSPRFLLLLEDKHIRPQNYFIREYLYRKIYSWDDHIVANLGAEKFVFPAYFFKGPIGDILSRDILISMISANKGQAIRTEMDLYKERRKVMKWYEKNSPDKFYLYGKGWDLPDHPDGLIAKFFFKALSSFKYFPKVQRKCWHGVVSNKHEVLIRSKFNLCFENFSGAYGYISEKIFDCFSAGCVPIYWGAPNIESVIPSDCYIDYRKFSDVGAMHKFLTEMTEDKYLRYQIAIRDFHTRFEKTFSCETFAENLSDSMICELHTIFK